MVDIIKAKKEFINHINNIDDPKVQRKIDHTYRVSKISKKIATELNLTQEKVKLAELIGLLHDIGRFEQYKRFSKNTKSNILDNSKIFDHGEAGVEILKKDNYIRKYIKEDIYDTIIYKAIYEHNKYELSLELSEEEKLFCKIIKDADKIDIIYEAIDIFWKKTEEIKEIESGELSEKMKEDFYSQKLANNVNRISEVDQILRFTSFIFDINFKCSFEILKESDNISKMIDRFNYKIPETAETMKKLKEIANKYIKDKIK